MYIVLEYNAECCHNNIEDWQDWIIWRFLPIPCHLNFFVKIWKTFCCQKMCQPSETNVLSPQNFVPIIHCFRRLIKICSKILPDYVCHSLLENVYHSWDLVFFLWELKLTVIRESKLMPVKDIADNQNVPIILEQLKLLKLKTNFISL